MNDLDIITPQQSSFQKNVLLFKDDVLKDVKKIENKLNTKFDSNSILMENKLNDYKNKIEILTQKVYDLSNLIIMDKTMQGKVEELLKFKDQIKDECMNQGLKIESNYKELHDSIFNHDKLISDSIIYPGVIGGMCKFKNLHEFIDFVLSNIKELLSFKEKNILDFKSFKGKLDSNLKNLKTQIENMSKTMSDYTKKCVHQSEIRMTDIINSYDDRIHEVRLENHKYAIELQEKANNLNNEIEKVNNVKDEIFDKVKREIDYVKQGNYAVTIKFEGYKKEFNQIKNRISQINDYMKDMKFKFKENKYEQNFNSNNDNTNKNKNNKVNNKKNESSPKKRNVESFLKKYIQGEVGINEIMHRNNNEEYSNNENKILNIQNVNNDNDTNESNSNNVNNNHHSPYKNEKILNNNSSTYLINQNSKKKNKDFYMNKTIKDFNKNNIIFQNDEELNELNQFDNNQMIKNIDFKNKTFSNIPNNMKKDKFLSQSMIESKTNQHEKYSQNESDNMIISNEDVLKQININHKLHKSVSSEDIKNFGTKSYSIFPKLPKRNSQNNYLNIARSYSQDEENEKNIGLSEYKNNNICNDSFMIPFMNLKKIPKSSLTAEMFKSIDKENSYFNNKNSLVSFIGNSIQVIHSKKNKNRKNSGINKSDIREKENNENNNKKKDVLNLSNRVNEVKELEKYVNQMKDNITYFKLDKNDDDDNLFINKKLFEKKYYNKKFKDNTQYVSPERMRNLYNLFGNENIDGKYSKLSKILNNVPKNYPKKNLLLNNNDKFSLDYNSRNEAK